MSGMLLFQRAAAAVQPLTVSIIPASVTEFAASCPVGSGNIEALPEGGSPPYTYFWDWAFGGSNLLIGSDDTKITSVARGVTGGSTGTLRVTVTDGVGAQVQDSIIVSLECGT